MKQSILRLKEFKRVLSEEWKSTEEIKEELGWFDSRMVYRAYQELKYLGFNIEKEKCLTYNQNKYRYVGGLL